MNPNCSRTVRAYFPITMSEQQTANGSYRFLKQKNDFEVLVDRYDNFLFGKFQTLIRL